ncbi:MAG: hydantoinase B/oxoprolinase family protein [Actinobacteria bacterium]|nr:hydantoinase B/oxoprolinase family protein [Actinomycetota bacterium]
MGKLKDALIAKETSIRERGCYEEALTLKEHDPIKFEVLYTKLVHSVLNAREVAALVSASPVVREMGECVFGLYTAEGDAICLSVGIMLHVHTMSRMIKWMIMNDYEEKVGFKEGDYFFNNDPYIGGTHSPDQLIVTPIFYDGELVGWSGGVTHVPETGAVEPGGLPASATTRFHEGIIMPCVRIAENDELKKDLEVFVSRNVRTPEWWLLDNRAKVAGCRMIRDDAKRLIAEYGVDYYAQAGHEYIEDTMRATKAKVKSVLFPGRYRATAVSGVGRRLLIHIPAEMTVDREGQLTVDFDGLSSPGAHPQNNTLPSTEGAFMCAAIQHVFYDSRYNEGTFHAMKLNVPFGTVLNPPNIFYATGLISTSITTGIAWNDCLSRAYYARGYREEVFAPNAMTVGMYCGGVDQYGRVFGAFNMESSSAGSGALGVLDGLDCAYAQWNPEADMGDAEVWEQILPMVWLGRGIQPDSGGYGKFRGGNSIESLFFVANTSKAEMGSYGGRLPVFTSPGIMGAYPGARTYRNIVQNTDLKARIDAQLPLPHYEGETPDEPEMVRLVNGKAELQRGRYAARPMDEYDVYYQTNGSGGGFGDPIERDPEMVRRDLINQTGLFSTAERVYGVALDPVTFEVDYAKTKELRAAIRRARLARGVPAKEYIAKTRQRVLRGELPEVPRDLYNDVLSISPKFARIFREFWRLPDDCKAVPAPATTTKA